MYTNLLTQLKNAQLVGKEELKFPYSQMDEKILEVLSRDGFIKSVEKKGRAPKKYFEIVLKYGTDGTGAITGFKFQSKPSRKLYTGYRTIRPVRQGFGIAVLTTPQGIMTNKEAIKSKVGGQLLFTIW